MVKEEVEYDMKIDEKIRSKVKLEGIEYEVFLYKNTIVPDRELLEKSMIDERARLKLKITAEAKKGKYASAEINRLKDIEGQLNQKIVAESNAIRSIPVTNQLSNDDLVNLRRELELSKSKLTQKEKEYATVKPDC